MQTQAFSDQQYEALVTEIIQHQHTTDDKSKYAGCVLRLAGRDLMDYRKGGKGPGTGGSDGCIDFEDPNNAGLPTCLVWTDLPGIYDKWCDQISLADFIVVAAEAVAGSLSPDYNANHKFNTDTLLARFKYQFEFGRKSVDECPSESSLTVDVNNGWSLRINYFEDF